MPGPGIDTAGREDAVVVGVSVKAQVIGAHRELICAVVVGVPHILQRRQRGVEVPQRAGHLNCGGTIGSPVGQGQPGRAAQRQRAVAHAERDQHRPGAGVDAQIAVHAVGVGDADAGERQRLRLGCAARPRHRDHRRLVHRNDGDVEHARGLVAAAGVRYGEMERVCRPLQSVVLVTHQSGDQIRLREGAAHAQNFAVEKQLAVLDVGGDAELHFQVGVVRIKGAQTGGSDDCRGAFVHRVLVSHAVVHEAVVGGDDGVVVHRYDADRHDGTGRGIARSRAIVRSECDVVGDGFAAVVHVAQTCHQIGCRDHGRSRGHDVGARIRGVVSLTRYHDTDFAVGIARYPVREGVDGSVARALVAADAVDVGRRDVGVVNHQRAGLVHRQARRARDRGLIVDGCDIDGKGLDGGRHTTGVAQGEIEAGEKVFSAVVHELDQSGVDIGLGEAAACRQGGGAAADGGTGCRVLVEHTVGQSRNRRDGVDPLRGGRVDVG